MLSDNHVMQQYYFPCMENTFFNLQDKMRPLIMKHHLLPFTLIHLYTYILRVIYFTGYRILALDWYRYYQYICCFSIA